MNKLTNIDNIDELTIAELQELIDYDTTRD